MADIAASLSSYFNNLAASQMETFRQPLYTLQKQQATLNTTRSVYAEVSTKLRSLRDSVTSLISTQTGTSLTSGRNIAVSNVATGFNVLTASVASTAIAGTYTIDNIVLGKEHRVSSDQKTSADQALNLTGTFVLGGALNRAFSAGTNTVADTVSGYETGSALSGQSELAGGTYTVETRLSGSTYQYRLVDSSGTAQSIQNGTTGAMTNSWQNITEGATADTGRGLKINFGSDDTKFAAGTAQLAFVPQGASISVSTADTLNTIANKINAATFPVGQGVAATVVDGRMILAGTTVGVGHDIIAADQDSDPANQILHQLGVLAGSDFKNILQAANTNTTFNVNGQPVTRYKNTGISDVISGVTLNFSSDAVGKSATVTVSPNWTNARSAIDAFVSKFNETQSYIKEQTAVTKNADDGSGKVSYSRGPIADDSSMDELVSSMYDVFSSPNSSGTYKFFSDIGITFDDSLKITVSDSAKLEEALNNNSSSVKTLMDSVMGKLEKLLGNFTGSTANNNTGYLSNVLKSIDVEVKDIGYDITDMNSSLMDRQNSLLDQYAAMQAQLLQMSYDQQAWSSIYGSYSSSG
jgi:flagellar hook-associated protein 2